MSVENAKLQRNSLALLLLKIYKSNRSLLLNTSYIILIIAAFTGATNTGRGTSSRTTKLDAVDEQALKRNTQNFLENRFKD